MHAAAQVGRRRGKPSGRWQGSHGASVSSLGPAIHYSINPQRRLVEPPFWPLPFGIVAGRSTDLPVLEIRMVGQNELRAYLQVGRWAQYPKPKEH